MAVLNVLITGSNLSIAEMNDRIMDKGDSRDTVNALIKLLQQMNCGALGISDVTIEITSRDSDVTVSTSGTGSDQETVSRP